MSQNPYVAPQQNVSLQPPADSRRHSIPGMISLGAALLGGLMFVGTIALAIVMSLSQGTPTETQEMLLGFLGLAAIGVMLVGLVLGFVGLLLPRSKKLFAVLGLIINGVCLASIVGLILFGLAVQSA